MVTELLSFTEVESGHSSGVRRGRAMRGAPTFDSANHAVAELFCPFDSDINPDVDRAQSRSVEWAQRVGLVGDAADALRLERARVAHLSALVFRTASPEVLELAAQWTTLFCILDDHIEARRAGTMKLAAYLQGLLDGFVGTRQLGGDGIGRAFESVKAALLELGGPDLRARFAVELERLFDGYLWEEFYRQTGSTPDLAAYRPLRTVTIGLGPQFLLGELERRCHDTRAIRVHPVIGAMEDATCRAVGWANDIFTHARELERGEPHNLIGVLMRSRQLSHDEAVEDARAMHDEEVARLLRGSTSLPHFGEFEEAARCHVQHLHRWIRGHLDWAIQTGRYAPGA